MGNGVLFHKILYKSEGRGKRRSLETVLFHKLSIRR